MDYKSLARQYETSLLNDIIPFWQNHSADDKNGGYLTSLDRHGQVYDTDKFIWLQGRQVWCFSKLYKTIEARPDWLDVALQGAHFLEKHGRDAFGNWYFSLTREGLPLVQPYNIFSDCYASMAFGQLYGATGDPVHKKIALDTFFNILSRKSNPKGIYSKIFPGTRPLQSFSLPMVLCSLVQELEPILPENIVTATIREGIHAVMDVFYQADSGLILENVTPEGHFSDSFEGRLLNPGHVMEAMWFVMDLAERSGTHGITKKAVAILLATIERGWDKEYGGIFCFQDISGNTPLQLEWDQKMWWVHVEALVALLKGYLYTGNNNCLKWFEIVHAYTWEHFPDPANGEWFGYLDRRGEVLLPVKGSKWKGCYHLPRGLMECWSALDLLGNQER